MDLSFQEKSAGASFVALLGVYGYYFYGVLNGAGPVSPGDMLSYMIALVIGLVIGLVIIEIVFHAVIAVFTPEEATDERDVYVRLKAYRLGYLLLAETAQFGAQLFYYRRGVA